MTSNPGSAADSESGSGGHVELRRVVVGLDADGRSAVTAIDAPLPGIRRPTGNVVHELWRRDFAEEDTGSAGVAPAVAVRRLIIPPSAPASEQPSRDAASELHRTNSLYVGTVASGSVFLVLEAGEILISPGDTFVLPDSMHSWRNPFTESAVVISTAFPLPGGATPEPTKGALHHD